MIRKENGTEPQQPVSDFPQNRYEALEESKRLLGISETAFCSLLETIGKADYSQLDFSLGDISLSFCSYGKCEVCLKLGFIRGPLEKCAEYTFQLCEIGLQRQKTLHDF